MDNLLLGIKGHAVCISKKTGEKLWSTKLKSTSGVTNILVEGDAVFVYSGGHLFGLDLDSGKIKWENRLDGMGYGPCIMASENQNASQVPSHMAAQQSSVVVASTDDGSDDDSGGGGD